MDDNYLQELFIDEVKPALNRYGDGGIFIDVDGDATALVRDNILYVREDDSEITGGD